MDDATCCTPSSSVHGKRDDATAAQRVVLNAKNEKNLQNATLTSNRGCSGKREHVCPSGPIPSSNISNTGKVSLGKACRVDIHKIITYRIEKTTVNMFTRLSGESSFKRSEDSAPPSVCVHSPRHTRSLTGRGQ